MLVAYMDGNEAGRDHLRFLDSGYRIQKRLAASILNCGNGKLWLDPNETIDNSMKNEVQVDEQEKATINLHHHPGLIN
ncbi:hypothetical protein NC652_034584 [Populus alba x Populus x berolinensis]|nr:hypothetical protein NC652_034584 [Populus alba x Populus x berolinensis]